MLLKFDQYINENRKEEDDFDKVTKGEVILYAGSKYRVKKVNPDGAHEIVPVKVKDGETPKSTKVSRAIFNQKCSRINE
jgi:hypothetical protein